ncbi:hypothetical protein EV05_0055 [Prochlorococcus sp. MIT 0601]|nr:hypothetical protein EV05_0055 [Prochlorococcus sp. MIT 0601]
MSSEKDQSSQNKEESNEKPRDSLLSYECEEDDDGNDWET